MPAGRAARFTARRFTVHGARFTVHGAVHGSGVGRVQRSRDGRRRRGPLQQRHKTRRHGDTRRGVTATQDAASRRHKTRRHGDTRLGVTATQDSASRRHKTRRHGDTRLGVTATQDSASRRHKTRRHGGTRRSVTAVQDAASHQSCHPDQSPDLRTWCDSGARPADAVSSPTRGEPEFIAPLSDRISELLAAYFVFRPALFQY